MISLAIVDAISNTQLRPARFIAVFEARCESVHSCNGLLSFTAIGIVEDAQCGNRAGRSVTRKDGS